MINNKKIEQKQQENLSATAKMVQQNIENYK